MDKGKVSLVVAEDETCLNTQNQRVFKVLIHDGNPEMLKKFCTTIEELMNERKLKLEEREK